MALITCPECGGQVSDKAESCPHCGYPIAKYLNNTESSQSDTEFVIYNKSNKYYSFTITKCRVLGGRPWTVLLNMIDYYFPYSCKMGSGEALHKVPYKLDTGILKENADWLKEEFQRHGTSIAVELDTGAKYNQRLNALIEKTRAEKDIVKCPKCGSTQITTGQRGYGMITGPFGSNKTVNRCAKCGYQWMPTDYGVQI